MFSSVQWTTRSVCVFANRCFTSLCKSTHYHPVFICLYLSVCLSTCMSVSRLDPSFRWSILLHICHHILSLAGRGVLSNGLQNPMKMSDISFLTEMSSKFKNSFSAVRFSKTDFTSFGDSFSHYLIRSSSSSMIASTVKDWKYLSSCHISELLVLSHFSWQLVGPVHHGSMSFVSRVIP